MLTFSIYTFSSCTYPIEINQDQSRQHLPQVRINAPIKGVSC
jgi:hypothetical protein